MLNMGDPPVSMRSVVGYLKDWRLIERASLRKVKVRVARRRRSKNRTRHLHASCEFGYFVHGGLETEQPSCARWSETLELFHTAGKVQPVHWKIKGQNME